MRATSTAEETGKRLDQPSLKGDYGDLWGAVGKSGSMALTGTYTRTLDEKQRVAVPKRLWEEFGETDLRSLYISPGTDKSLSLYSPRGFETLTARMAEQSTTRVDVRNYLRLLYSRSEKVDLDGQGRIRIPERLVEFGSLQRDIVLLGVHDHAEIWDAGAWEQFLAKNGAEFDEMAARAFNP